MFKKNHICCMFFIDLWETLNIMQPIFDEGKESAGKTMKVKLLLRIVLKIKQLSNFLNKTSV